MIDKLKMHSPNKVNENIDKIGKLFPNCLTERKNEKGEIEYAIDFDILKQELSSVVVEGSEERYQFTWPDKKKSILLANAPIAKTLRPCPEESVDFDNTENLYIEGDNLDVLKLLQETYLGKVKMIYIDPPYNTGKNYIYKNDFTSSIKEYIEKSGQYNNEGDCLVANLETNGKFHTDWLNMIYPRLRIAKQLLSPDGVLVLAIDENELATISMVLKEIFSETSYEHVCVSVVHNPGGTQGNNFSRTHEYAIFIFPKNFERIIQLQNRKEKPDIRPLRDVSTGNHLRTDAKNCFYPIFIKDKKIIGFGDVSKDSYHPESANIIRPDGIIEVYPIDAKGNERKWVWARQTVEQIAHELRVVYNKNRKIMDIERVKTHFNYKTVWTDDIYNANSHGSKLLATLMPNSGFNFPKSLYTVLECIRSVVINDKDALILDFFSGSATTAHAIMQMNTEDGGSRKYIMVQLPENLNTSFKNAVGENKKSLGKTIKFLSSINKPCLLTEIGKERIRRAGKKILEDNKDKEGIENLDIGFRVLKLDSSNMKDTFYTPADYEKNLLDKLTDNIKEDRSPEDLLFQVMLDLGILLSSKIEESTISGKKVFNVAEGFLIACFDENVTEETVKAIAKQKPYYFVMRDSSMASDSVATNFDQIFATYSPDTVRKVL